MIVGTDAQLFEFGKRIGRATRQWFDEAISKVVDDCDHKIKSLTSEVAALRSELQEFKTAPLRYRGVFEDGRKYSPGDTVTWGGSMWFCSKEDTTAKPGLASDESRGAWVMCVRKGSEGKTGPPGPPGRCTCREDAR